MSRLRPSAVRLLKSAALCSAGAGLLLAISTAAQQRGSGAAPSLYVSPGGDDSNAGGIAVPLKTIAHAMTKLRPGGTLVVREGAYHETLRHIPSGTPNAPTQIMVQPGETAVLDGQTRIAYAVLIEDAQYIRISGLEITGYTSYPPFRISHARHIHISGVEIHHNKFSALHIGGPAEDILVENSSFHDQKGHGLMIYNIGPGVPIQDVVIRNCQFYHARAADGIQVRGYRADAMHKELHVDEPTIPSGITISHNRFWDNDEQGVDLKDCVGVSILNNVFFSTPGDNKIGDSAIILHVPQGPAHRRLYNRNQGNLIKRNVFHSMTKAIGMRDSALREIDELPNVIEENYFYNCAQVLVLASYATTRDDYPAEPGASCSTIFRNNTVIGSGREDSREAVKIRNAINTSVYNNILYEYESPALFIGPADGRGGKYPGARSTGNLIDHNLYYSTKCETIAIHGGERYSDLAAFRGATGFELHGLYGDPILAKVNAEGCTIAPGSPAIGAGLKVDAMSSNIGHIR